MKKSPFEITIDRQVIKLLGAHLYGDTPSVVNELIANSYDAGAKRVWITVKTNKPYQISVQDDGIGMSLEDINKYYLNIGYNRRDQSDLQDELKNNGIERSDMGQKGIGKLAVFALSKQVKLISCKNNKYIRCFMDFDKICEKDGQPDEFDTNGCEFAEEFLSDNGSGTLIILENVVKDLSKSYKYLASSIARSFVLNNKDIQVFIRKDAEAFREIKRNNLDYYNYMDVLATIGDGFDEVVDKVNNNSIEEKYKRIIKYEDLVAETSCLSPNKRFDALPKKISVFDRTKTNEVEFNFKFRGWLGTVKNEDSFKSVLSKDGYNMEDINDKEIIVVDDNRISIYSRGKVGEYNILPKLKTKAANDAYLIGEIYVDDFEENSLIDMATSNRRGYQEDDIRYETLCKNLKLLESKVVYLKQQVNKQRKIDEDEAESNEIKSNFKMGHIKSKAVFDNMSDDDREAIEEDHKQFSRAVALDYQDRKPTRLLISHKQYELRQYGDFIINVLISLNPDLKNRIVFTSNPTYGLQKGKNIFNELKQCFRPDYYILFLFTRSFYDSNSCLAEAGAAWATNRKYMNIVVDIDFSDVDKPLDNCNNGAKFCLNTADSKVEFAKVIQTVLAEIDKNYELDDILDKIDNELQNKTYSFSLPIYHPKRKHQLYPLCDKCGRILHPVEDNGEIYYECECGQSKRIKAKVE